VRETVVLEHPGAEPVGAVLAHPGLAEPPAVEAGRAERWASASAQAEVFGFAAWQARVLRVWPQPAELWVVAVAELLEQPVSPEPPARRTLSQRAPAPQEQQDAQEELAAVRREQAQVASPRPDFAPEAARLAQPEPAVSPQPAEARGWRASSEPLLGPPLWLPDRQRPLLQRRHPARPGPESCGEPSPRRRQGSSSSGSSFPRRRSRAKGQ